MYVPYRQHCIRLLGLQIHSNLDGLKDSQLLAAYASYQTIKRLHTDMPYRIIDAQQVKDAMAPYSNRTFYRDFSGYNLSSFSPAFAQAFDLPLEQFLRFGTPQLVFDIDRLFSVFRSNHITDINQQVYLILTIKYALFLMPGDVKDNSKETISEDFTQRLYATYSEKIKHPSQVSLPSKEVLAELYRAINMYPLDPSELAVSSVDYEHMKEMSHLLSDILQQPRANQREIAAGFMMEGKQGRTVLERNPAIFSSVRNARDQTNTLKDALRSMGQVSPLDVLCQIYLHQKAAKNGVSANIHPNDVMLENSLIYSLFTSNFSPVLAQDHHAVVFFPSPFFIRKWAKDPSLKSQKVTFVMEDFASASLLSQHYHEELGRPKDALTFVSYTQWTAEVQQTKTVTGDIVLVFGLQLDCGIRTGIFETLAKRGRALTVYELLPRRDIGSEISNASAFALQSVAWLPLGINHAAQPKSKVLLTFKRTDASSSEADPQIESYRFGLSTEFGMQSIAQLLQEGRPFTLLTKETIKSGKWKTGTSNCHRSEPLCYAFTPDLNIWYSQAGRAEKNPVVDAYVCGAPKPEKVQRGYLPRGVEIKETHKRTTAIPNGQVLDWLEYDYPFSVRGGRAKKTESDIAVPAAKVSIRDAIIEKLLPQFREQDIALKTLWYLYPELEDRMSASDYTLLSEMVRTDLGCLSLRNSGEEDYINLLTTIYAEERQDRIKRKCQILYTVIGFAIEQKHCEYNPLRQLVTDENHSRKAFSQIRTALTVKSLTADEFRLVYHAIRDKLEAGDYQYLGVMIRLLTGLESNIVCALRWKDFQSSPIYGISTLTISRQITNDGKDTIGFTSMEDYRIQACCETLEKHLSEQKNRTKQLLANCNYRGSINEFPIVLSVKEADNWQDYEAMLTPKALEQLSKEMLAAAQIDDHVISVPDYSHGTKETNLSHYQGDFFRENMRYWCLEWCRFTPDELAYYIGNMPETTLGRHYCDFMAEGSLLIHAVKLRRLDSILVSSDADSISGCQTCLDSTHYSREIEAPHDQSLKLFADIVTTEENQEIRFCAKNKYGMDIQIVPCKEQ